MLEKLGISLVDPGAAAAVPGDADGGGGEGGGGGGGGGGGDDGASEILYTEIEDVSLEFVRLAEGDDTVELIVDHFQLNNQLMDARYPVLLAPRPLKEHNPVVHLSALIRRPRTRYARDMGDSMMYVKGVLFIIKTTLEPIMMIQHIALLS